MRKLAVCVALIGVVFSGCGGMTSSDTTPPASRPTGQEVGDPVISAAVQGGAPLAAWGTVSWVHLAAAPYNGVAVAPYSTRSFPQIFASQDARIIGDPSSEVFSSQLDCLFEDGKFFWTDINYGFSINSLSVSGDGQSVYTGGYDVSHPTPPPAAIVRYAADRSSRVIINGGSDECSFQTAARFNGHELFLKNCGGYPQLSYGIPAVWTFETYGASFYMTRATFDPQGNVIVAGINRGVYTINGWTFGAAGRTSVLVLKFTAQGSLLWAHEMGPAGGNAYPADMAISATGTVVVAGTFSGFAHWAGGSYDSAVSSSFLFTLESTGKSRWFRQPTQFEAGTLRLALDPSGRAFVAGRASDCGKGIHVDEINLAGDNLGAKGIACSANLDLKSAAALGHDLLLAGGNTGAVDFGNGTTTSTNGGFLLRMIAL